jgi:hypothetical protein
MIFFEKKLRFFPQSTELKAEKDHSIGFQENC